MTSIGDNRIVRVDLAKYPHLFEEREVEWGPIRSVFELTEPPSELISNVVMTPVVRDDWLIIRQDSGWGIVGGTLKPGESYLEAIERELLEEAGAKLMSFHVFGAFRYHTSAAKPYRPHLPHPVFYRIAGYGEVEVVGTLENPPDGERVLQVGTFALDKACGLMIESGQEEIAELYQLAAEIRL